MIEVHNLSKRYGSHLAVDDISFTIDTGEIVGFLGPNGAGKSTTMNIITGYISATCGEVSVDGFNLLEHPKEVKRRIGYMPEIPPLYPEMTVLGYLKFAASIKEVPTPVKKRIPEEIMGRVKIDHVADRLIRNLSKGYRQRVGLAQALIGNPPVLILDEPTIGLDPNQIVEIRNLIKELGRERTVVLSSHVLPEVTAVCDRVMIIHQGRIVASDTLAGLSAETGRGRRLTLRALASAEQLIPSLERLPELKIVRLLESREPGSVDLYLEAAGEADIRIPVSQLLWREKVPILMMRSADTSLEEIFAQLTTERAEG